MSEKKAKRPSLDLEGFLNALKARGSPEENRKLFDNYLNEVRRRELSNSQNYDKAILTLSSVALGFSLAAVELENAEYFILIGISWFLLIVTIICTMTSFIVSNKALRESSDNAKKYYLEDDESAFYKLNIYDKINSILNYASGAFLVIAIITIVLFRTFNV